MIVVAGGVAEAVDPFELVQEAERSDKAGDHLALRSVPLN